MSKKLTKQELQEIEDRLFYTKYIKSLQFNHIPTSYVN